MVAKFKTQSETVMGNLRKYFSKADAVDLSEGMVAYERYNMVMRRLSDAYGFPVASVCAAFCALSPNSDYVGNLRSTVSVLQGVLDGKPDEDIVVSTYNHCKLRALSYVRGIDDFEEPTRGPKILNFYYNILHPNSQRWVTIDGHMVGVMNDHKGTMRELLITRSDYFRYADYLKAFAFSNFMLPNQMQAVLWFVRKRLLNVVYSPQWDMFAESGDAWRTARDISTIKPYTKRDKSKIVKDSEYPWQESML